MYSAWAAALAAALACGLHGCAPPSPSAPERKEVHGRMKSIPSHAHTNRLAGEKSPYLLQHAHNPVDWYPWGEEAFAKAKRENKPVFLSIGYSTCHWCHVMEKESFEDERVAAVLNGHFVPVKVDREERPDIDRIYMDVCMAMTGAGGWPLTIVMTPDGKPFFATTYIPREERWGRPGIIELLTQMSAAWERDRAGASEVGERAAAMLRAREPEKSEAALDSSVIEAARDQLRSGFDRVHGGFGRAPKFPSAHNLSFLLRSGGKSDTAMVEKTLDAMARGGIYDQVGFGFHRYSVDAEWLVPHFEKMLYDQAMLAIAYIEGWQATRKSAYRRTAEEIFTYVLRDMRAPGGGFYSAEDADSEGEEGKFYVWRPEEVREILGESDGKIICRYYGITPRGNFEKGASIAHVAVPAEEFAKREGIPAGDFAALLKEAGKKLLAAREKRIRPHRDDKILADWNGLMIAALAKGGRAFDEPKYTRAAARAADFVLDRMKASDGRLFHRYRDGEAAVPGFLDDYAFMVWGLSELYEATFEVKYLREALSLNDSMIELFGGGKGGGFFFSGKGNEKLIAGSREVRDGAYPSGNSIAALNLLRLGRITGRRDLEKKADGLFAAFAGQVRRFPSAHTQFLTALRFALQPGREVVIAGEPGRDDSREMLRALGETFLPGTVVILHPPGKMGEEIEKIVPFVKGQDMAGGKATAYVCENFTCSLPVTGVEELTERLGATRTN